MEKSGVGAYRQGDPQGSDVQGWLEVIGGCWLLGAESAMVIPLRLTRLAAGGTVARKEAELMVSEKIEAHGRLANVLADGGLGDGPQAIAGGVVSYYLAYVRGNRRRLVNLLK